MNNIVGRLQSILSPQQLNVVIGSLLGDARLECRSVGLRYPITARLRMHHGEKQKEYLLWKYQILRDFVSKGPREISWDNPKRNLHEVSWYFHTRSLEEFGVLHSLLYRDKKKIFPHEIFEMLNPEMIAVWFMDDGSNIGSGFTLNTHSFSYEEQVSIARYFKQRHAIAATIVKDRTKFKIAIGKYDQERFSNLVRPFMIPSMSYKIVNPRNDLIALRSELGNIRLSPS